MGIKLSVHDQVHADRLIIVVGVQQLKTQSYHAVDCKMKLFGSSLY